METLRLTIATPEDMESLGARVAGRLRAGDLVALDGELGAGKTTFARGLGAALGVRGAVTSPTFVLARSHPREGGAPLVHVDAYRLSSAAELDDLDIDVEGSIVVVEWAAGMIEVLGDSWLEVAIVRPTGAGAAGDPDAVGGADAVDPESADPAEPREVAITGHGPRFMDFRL
ncbi:MAG TPA: tRNA (adenosine(37)-N6)-threonylcarbamoyltransferase complex ATPase subunit type 1 TsaE [Terrimesophilobacter sp.]|nr:tRNA (adenosine(37)-N6)-threonylcarbamoyltransferase complex ATPase subunit type 1 TsaE [Terrimesophilobacter sp.]